MKKTIPEWTSKGKVELILSTILLISIPSYEVSGRSNNPNSADVLGANGPGGGEAPGLTVNKHLSKEEVHQATMSTVGGRGASMHLASGRCFGGHRRGGRVSKLVKSPVRPGTGKSHRKHFLPEPMPLIGWEFVRGAMAVVSVAD